MEPQPGIANQMRTEAELSQLRSKVSTLETELVETRKVLLETRLQMNDCTKQAAFSAGLLLKANVNDVKESLSVVMKHFTKLEANTYSRKYIDAALKKKPNRDEVIDMVDNTTREILYRITTGNDIPGLATSLKEDAGLMKRVEENKSNIKQLKEDEMRKFIKMEKGMTKITQQIHKDHKDITNMTEAINLALYRIEVRVAHLEKKSHKRKQIMATTLSADGENSSAAVPPGKKVTVAERTERIRRASVMPGPPVLAPPRSRGGSRPSSKESSSIGTGLPGMLAEEDEGSAFHNEQAQRHDRGRHRAHAHGQETLETENGGGHRPHPYPQQERGKEGSNQGHMPHRPPPHRGPGQNSSSHEHDNGQPRAAPASGHSAYDQAHVNKGMTHESADHVRSEHRSDPPNASNREDYKRYGPHGSASGGERMVPGSSSQQGHISAAAEQRNPDGSDHPQQHHSAKPQDLSHQDHGHAEKSPPNTSASEQSASDARVRNQTYIGVRPGFYMPRPEPQEDKQHDPDSQVSEDTGGNRRQKGTDRSHKGSQGQNDVYGHGSTLDDAGQQAEYPDHPDDGSHASLNASDHKPLIPAHEPRSPQLQHLQHHQQQQQPQSLQQEHRHHSAAPGPAGMPSGLPIAGYQPTAGAPQGHAPSGTPGFPVPSDAQSGAQYPPGANPGQAGVGFPPGSYPTGGGPPAGGYPEHHGVHFAAPPAGMAQHPGVFMSHPGGPSTHYPNQTAQHPDGGRLQPGQPIPGTDPNGPPPPNAVQNASASGNASLDSRSLISDMQSDPAMNNATSRGAEREMNSDMQLQAIVMGTAVNREEIPDDEQPQVGRGRMDARGESRTGTRGDSRMSVSSGLSDWGDLDFNFTALRVNFGVPPTDFDYGDGSLGGSITTSGAGSRDYRSTDSRGSDYNRGYPNSRGRDNPPFYSNQNVRGEYANTRGDPYYGGGGDSRGSRDNYFGGSPDDEYFQFSRDGQFSRRGQKSGSSGGRQSAGSAGLPSSGGYANSVGNPSSRGASSNSNFRRPGTDGEDAEQYNMDPQPSRRIELNADNGSLDEGSDSFPADGRGRRPSAHRNPDGTPKDLGAKSFGSSAMREPLTPHSGANPIMQRLEQTEELAYAEAEEDNESEEEEEIADAMMMAMIQDLKERVEETETTLREDAVSLVKARVGIVEKTLHALAEEKSELNSSTEQTRERMGWLEDRLQSLSSQVITVLQQEANRVNTNEEELRSIGEKAGDLDKAIMDIKMRVARDAATLKNQLIEKMTHMARKNYSQLAGEGSEMQEKMKKMRNEIEALKEPLENQIMDMKEEVRGVIGELHRHQSLYRDMLAEYTLVVNDCYSIHEHSNEEIASLRASHKRIQESIARIKLADPTGQAHQLLPDVKVPESKIKVLSPRNGPEPLPMRATRQSAAASRSIIMKDLIQCLRFKENQLREPWKQVPDFKGSKKGGKDDSASKAGFFTTQSAGIHNVDSNSVDRDNVPAKLVHLPETASTWRPNDSAIGPITGPLDDYYESDDDATLDTRISPTALTLQERSVGPGSVNTTEPGRPAERGTLALNLTNIEMGRQPTPPSEPRDSRRAQPRQQPHTART